MSRHADTSGISIQVSRDVVVASIQVDLDDDVLARFRDDLLHRIQASGCHGVILDASGLETLDSAEFASLRRIITMTTIMGADTVLVGLRPGVVSALIETGADVDGLRAAINLDAAFDLLQPVLDPADGADDTGDAGEADGADAEAAEGKPAATPSVADPGALQ